MGNSTFYRNYREEEIESVWKILIIFTIILLVLNCNKKKSLLYLYYVFTIEKKNKINCVKT